MRFLSQLALPATAVQFTTAFAWENISRMVGWHHQLSGHGFEQTPGDSEERESGMLAAWMGVHAVALDTT